MIISFSSGLIYTKSSTYDYYNYDGVFLPNFFKYYTEETAAANFYSADSRVANINSIFEGKIFNKNEEDGSEKPILQQNSLLSYNSTENSFESLEDIPKSSISTYTVQEGDVLSFIASDYGVSVNSIIWANNLKNADNIKQGMELKIPPVTGVIHIVKSGETVSSIANKYGADSQKIIDFNSLPLDGNIHVGLNLIVPDGKFKSPNTPVYVSSKPAAGFTHLPDLGNYFMIPTQGRVTQWIHGRNGIDVANSWGTPIYAAADGVVTVSLSSGWNGGFGRYIKISHPNGTATLYAHLTQTNVTAGQYVARGQLIGLMGSTGRSTGPHLHFEVHGARNPLLK